MIQSISSLQKSSWKIFFEFRVNPVLSYPAFEQLAPALPGY